MILLKNVNKHKKRVLISSTTFVWNISHSKKNSAGYYNKCKVPTVFVRLQGKFNFLNRVYKNTQISNFVKIRQVGAELFHAGGRMDGRIVTFRNLGNTSNNFHCISIQPLGRFEQEPEPSQATGMALAHCILGKFLGVGCHCVPPPLDVPTFSARCLHVQRRERPLAPEGGTLRGREMFR